MEIKKPVSNIAELQHVSDKLERDALDNDHSAENDNMKIFRQDYRILEVPIHGTGKKYLKLNVKLAQRLITTPAFRFGALRQ